MAGNFPHLIEQAVLDALFPTSGTKTIGSVTVTGPVKVRLMTANGTDNAAGTELATSGGYTAGGSAITMGASTNNGASNGSQVTTTASVSWSNMPAATIVGIEVWDASATPQRLAYGALSASKTTNSGDTFTLTAGQVTLTLD